MSMERFLGQLLHDIRNHLNGIILQATDVQETLAEQGVQADLSPVVRQAMALAEELKRVRASVEPEPARLGPTDIREWWRSLRERVELTGQKVNWSQEPSGVVDCDPDLLAQAVLLLLDNAFRFGKSGAEPQVAGIGEGAQFLVTVINAADAAADLNVRNWPKLGYTTRAGARGAGCFTTQKMAVSWGGSCTWEVAQADGHTRIQATLCVVKQDIMAEMGEKEAGTRINELPRKQI